MSATFSFFRLSCFSLFTLDMPFQMLPHADDRHYGAHYFTRRYAASLIVADIDVTLSPPRSMSYFSSPLLYFTAVFSPSLPAND